MENPNPNLTRYKTDRCTEEVYWIGVLNKCIEQICWLINIYQSALPQIYLSEKKKKCHFCQREK
jgi:hypothetical protein